MNFQSDGVYSTCPPSFQSIKIILLALSYGRTRIPHITHLPTAAKNSVHGANTLLSRCQTQVSNNFICSHYYQHVHHHQNHANFPLITTIHSTASTIDKGKGGREGLGRDYRGWNGRRSQEMGERRESRKVREEWRISKRW